MDASVKASKWKRASGELQLVRDRELRELRSQDVARAASILNPVQRHQGIDCGLVTQQLWFMRQRLLKKMQ